MFWSRVCGEPDRIAGTAGVAFEHWSGYLGRRIAAVSSACSWILPSACPPGAPVSDLG